MEKFSMSQANDSRCASQSAIYYTEIDLIQRYQKRKYRIFSKTRNELIEDFLVI